MYRPGVRNRQIFSGTDGRFFGPVCGFAGSVPRQVLRPTFSAHSPSSRSTEPAKRLCLRRGVPFVCRSNKGFTLLEALIALSIVAILMTVAIPSLSRTVSNARRTSIINDLITSAHLARMSAIKRNQQLVICADEGARSCRANGDWRKGWLVFVNADGDWPPQLGDNDTVLQRYAPVGRHLINSNRSYYAFHRVGRRSTNGTLTICDDRYPAQARAVIISYTGRPRVSRHQSDGSALECF